MFSDQWMEGHRLNVTGDAGLPTFELPEDEPMAIERLFYLLHHKPLPDVPTDPLCILQLAIAAEKYFCFEALKYALGTFLQPFVFEEEQAKQLRRRKNPELQFLYLLTLAYMLDNASAFQMLSAEVMFMHTCAIPLIAPSGNIVTDHLPSNLFGMSHPSFALSLQCADPLQWYWNTGSKQAINRKLCNALRASMRSTSIDEQDDLVFPNTCFLTYRRYDDVTLSVIMPELEENPRVLHEIVYRLYRDIWNALESHWDCVICEAREHPCPDDEIEDHAPSHPMPQFVAKVEQILHGYTEGHRRHFGLCLQCIKGSSWVQAQTCDASAHKSLQESRKRRRRDGT